MILLNNLKNTCIYLLEESKTHNRLRYDGLPSIEGIRQRRRLLLAAELLTLVDTEKDDYLELAAIVLLYIYIRIKQQNCE